MLYANNVGSCVEGDAGKMDDHGFIPSYITIGVNTMIEMEMIPKVALANR